MPMIQALRQCDFMDCTMDHEGRILTPWVRCGDIATPAGICLAHADIIREYEDLEDEESTENENCQ
jgi:hypothetical protein